MTLKTQNVREGSKKCRSFKMHLNLNDYQFKTCRYSYRATYMSSMVIVNQKLTIKKQTKKPYNRYTKQNKKGTKPYY